MQTDPSELIGVDELSRRLGVPKSWLYARTARTTADPIPHIRLGRYVRFEWPVVLLWLKGRSQS